MAQNTYYSQPPYDPRAQPYAYPAYSQQHQQPYGIPGQSYQPSVQYRAPMQAHYGGYDAANMSMNAPHSPLPPPPPSPGPVLARSPSAFGRPQPTYSPAPPYTPVSFGPRQGYQATPQTPARRPLPDPRARRADSLAGAPSTTPPASRAPMHRPTLSTSALPSASPPGSGHAEPPKTATATVPPRPLPQPHAIPRSVAQSNLARSPSPARHALPEPPSSSSSASSSSGTPPSVLPPPTPAGQKFVPHWKRALPAPKQPAAPTQSPEWRDGAMGPAAQPMQRQQSGVRPLPPSPPAAGPSQSRGGGASVHPLPPIPTTPQRQQASLPQMQTQPASPPRMLPQPNVAGPSSLNRTASTKSAATDTTEGSTDNEDLASHALLMRPANARDADTSKEGQEQETDSRDTQSSPQYGILDLPSRIRATPSNSSSGSARDTDAHSSAFRFAMMSLEQEKEGQKQAGEKEAGSDKPARSTPSPGPAGQSPRPQLRAHSYSQSTPNVNTSAGVRPHPMPPMTRGGSSQSNASTSSNSSTGKWPTGLPPLPRAPGSSSSEGIKFDLSRPRPRTPVIDLDDAPPPSLRRSPSPARSAARTPTPGEKAPASSFFQNHSISPVREHSRKGSLPTSIRTHALERSASAMSRSADSPVSASSPYASSPYSNSPSPLSAVSTSSAFTLSSFPRPPSQPPQPRQNNAQPRTPQSAASAKTPGTASSSGSSVFTLSSFPPPPSRPVENKRNGWSGPPVGCTGSNHAAEPAIPSISLPGGTADDGDGDSDEDSGPMIAVSGPDDDAPAIPSISVGAADDGAPSNKGLPQFSLPGSTPRAPSNKGSSPLEHLIRKGSGLACGGCGGAIVGRTVSAMGARWHPGCFRCCVCNELLENLSSYEHEGRAYCHFDYHEMFAPKCYHCETAIVDERFITLDDPELGKRTYHEQHFFCAECGDPFLAPAAPSRGPIGGQTFSGDGEFSGGGDDDVGFTVYRGHPYCESCHVRLRLPKCKRCKKPIRDGARAVEALGGKWCWECFVCASCGNPFEDPSFFQRDGLPFCEHCFSIMIKNEM
ncbi:hypothetical protein WOLCODRAFT_27728 [Wolfiporia cocos MD-104 SS10]|uniref:LIM zinc-binding domain-containing protein n=1 Tax=Wolfiporia cocos (strain MD-104) TaxID=742152 RepID=A0A2H3IZR8_WOLCO|nr:hypothetical protein WOLCODRAFT_27728 [Wolfiporia cocos MD-104 SS10]